MTRNLLTLAVLLSSSIAFGQDLAPSPTPAPSTSENTAQVTWPALTPFIGVDVIGALPLENSAPLQEKFRFRTLDFGARLDFDQDLSVVLDMGGRDENGTLAMKLREGYVQEKFGTSRVRAGTYFLGLGILGRRPVETWPFPSAPLTQADLFSDERAYDSGVEYTYEPNERLNLELGITNGYWFGAAPANGGDKPLTPTHYARPAWTVPIGDGAVELAVDYVSRVDINGERMRIGSFEAAFSRGEAKNPAWLTWLEVDHLYRQPANLPLEEHLGGFLYNQGRIDEKWSAGLRLDALTIPTLTSSSGNHRENMQAALVPVVAYRISESSQLRSAYTYLRETRDGDSTRSEQRIEFQFAAFFDRFPTIKAK